MVETLDDLTYNHEEDGFLVRKQLERVVLQRGAWATVMFLFQELDRKSGKFRDPMMAIVRFKKSHGSYRKQSAFNVSDEKQARELVAVFNDWCPRMAPAMDGAGDDGDGGGDNDGDGDQGSSDRRESTAHGDDAP